MQIPVGMNIPVRTEEQQILFYDECYDRYQKAAEHSSVLDYYYSIADTVVRLQFAGGVLANLMTPALEHLRLSEPTEPDCTFYIWDSESTGVDMVPPPCNITHYTDRGDIWGFNSNRIKTAFHWSEFSVNVMDLNQNEAVYWVKNPEYLPYWSASSPFRTLFHWWMEKNDCQLLHAAAVGTDDGAVLITGKGGKGKSTTALISLHDGLYYLADDYLVVKKDPEPWVYSLYSTAKINRGEIKSFPKFQDVVGDRVEQQQEKDVLYLYPKFKHQIRNGIPLRGILVPNVKKQEITRSTGAQFWRVYRAMSFSTMSQLPGVGPHTHEYLQSLCRKLPISTLELGQNYSLISPAITRYLSDPDKYTGTQEEESGDEDKPLVSVIIPVYNGEKFIREAIDNILSQGYPALEIIVVDDGSTDRLSHTIESLPYDIRYFKQENAGPAAARNWGIKDASGKYLAFLDVDDLWPQNNLNILVEELEKQKEAEVVRGSAQLFKNRADGSIEYLGNPEESFSWYIGAGLYRREVFDKVGLFDWTLIYAEDTDWYNRAGELNVKIKQLEEVTLFVRRHGRNMTEGKNIVELNKLKTFKKILDRKRGK